MTAKKTVICVAPYFDLTLGKAYEVQKESDDHFYVVTDHGESFGFYKFRFKDETEAISDAKSLLEKEGYTITPPKPKLQGEVVVYKNSDGVWCMIKDQWDRLSQGGYVKHNTVLSIVPWIEGQGLSIVKEKEDTI